MDIMELNVTQDANGSRAVEGMEIPQNQAAIITAYIISIVVAVGIPGNTLVILAVLLSKRLQTVSNIFIVNLAVADLITCCILPVKASVHWTNFYSTSLERRCKVELTIVHICVGASLYSLSSIALNRFIGIVSSTQFYKNIYQAKFIVFKLIVIWMIPMSVSILPAFVFGVGQIGFDFHLHTCLPLKEHPTTHVLNDIIIYVLYPLPLFIIVFCYTAILVKVLLHNRRLRKCGVIKHQGNVEDAATRPRKRKGAISQSIALRFSPIEVQITKNLFLVFLAYVLCLTPLAVCTMIPCHVDQNYLRTLVLFNSVINPLIYGFKHPLFRQVFVSILRCRRIPEPSSFLKAISRSVSND
ncbi:melatonin receptor type 1A-like [Apostichopus japonicus]|uniref:melatonin receptor type 1A-like n=1 Tax=Stichopus japonicus TaxID=307972 RepID=UPI003AB6082B